MHKGVILLTNASDREEAIERTQAFLVQHGDGNVWDWYVIGGRWSGTLNPKTKEFFEKVDAHFKASYPDNKHGFVSMAMVEEQTAELNKFWQEVGGEGVQPYARSSYQDFGYEDDIVPLSTCVDVINAWKKNINQEAEDYWEKMVEAKKDGAEHDMTAYYAKRYAELKYDEFCFESNVFDIENHTNDPKEALENVENYFAVMIDMHN